MYKITYAYIKNPKRIHKPTTNAIVIHNLGLWPPCKHNSNINVPNTQLMY